MMKNSAQKRIKEREKKLNMAEQRNTFSAFVWNYTSINSRKDELLYYIQTYKELKKDCLTWTEGTINAKGELIAITNSAEDMSGSPLLTNEDGKWKVIGILIGGPAVLGHFEINSIFTPWYEESEFCKFSENLITLANEKGGFDSVKLLCSYIKGAIIKQKDKMLVILKAFYYSRLKYACKMIRKKIKESYAIC